MQEEGVGEVPKQTHCFAAHTSHKSLNPKNPDPRLQTQNLTP